MWVSVIHVDHVETSGNMFARNHIVIIVQLITVGNNTSWAQSHSIWIYVMKCRRMSILLCAAPWLCHSFWVSSKRSRQCSAGRPVVQCSKMMQNEQRIAR